MSNQKTHKEETKADQGSRAPASTGLATFAGGCFWCMEPPFEKLDGVTDVVSGYTGGKASEPTYDQVTSGETGHLEAIQVRFDPARVSFKKLLDIFWQQIDPTDPGGQFADRGSQYQTAIFYHDQEQRAVAEASREELANSGRFSRPIATAILPFERFYPAEDYHQDYHKKQPVHYNAYRRGSGRQAFIDRNWGKTCENKNTKRSDSTPDEAELRKKLSPLQYHVTRENGTEPPFDNTFWDNKEEGIYVDIVSGEPLFSSRDKFHSGTGWPSFKRPLKADNVVEKKDLSLGMSRIEVRSRGADSHLGHLFDDGPGPTGQRYCINSASLRFIPKQRLKQEGYGEYLKLFE